MSTTHQARVAISDRPRERQEAVVEATALCMRYEGHEAVRGIDLRVGRGEIFAMLGPNGAGKTTTVEMLEGHRDRTSGHVRVLGRDPQHAGAAWRARVGVVLQSSRAEPELTVKECLELYAGYYPAPRPVEDVIELAGLGAKADVRAGLLSGGQQRRMDVALALIGDPDLLFLDEPTTGFDPSARRQAWGMIKRLQQLGKTIFLTTHFMDEAEALADRIAVIRNGQIVAEGTPETLGGRDSSAYEVSFRAPAGVRAGQIPLIAATLCTGPEPDRITLSTCDVALTLLTLSEWAVSGGHELADLHVARPSLEDVYLTLTESR
jgi:ABC-2 type transport system ATP-binding protein